MPRTVTVAATVAPSSSPTVSDAPSASPIWSLRLLGGLRAVGGVSGCEEVTRFRTQKSAALLAYLALPAGRSHSREELSALLWPEAEPDTARTNLRTALRILRGIFEGPGLAEPATFLATEGRDHLLLRADSVTVDVAVFETELRRAAARAAERDSARETAHLEAALAAYGGPLLPGLYEEWALTERDRLALAFRRALLRLSHLRAEAGDAPAALDHALRALAEDALDEDAHAAVVRLHLMAGRRTDAERQFAELTRLLDEQLGTEPSRAVRRLLQAPLHPLAGTRPHNGGARSSSDVLLSGTPIIGGGGGLEGGLSPKATTPTNLPPYVNRFFGREEEFALLRRLLGDGGARLVTLTGPGGTGKTRLAVEAARSLAEEGGLLPGGVWFVPLADLRDPALLPAAIARAMGLSLPEQGTASSPFDALLSVLPARCAEAPTLLLLDNLEHLLAEPNDPAGDPAGDAVAALFAGVPGLSLLVTSQHRLLLDGEREVPISPLQTPDGEKRAAGIVSGDALLASPAVALFVARARTARPDFQVTPRNAAVIGELVRRLEGVPLAIELAAALVQTLTPAQILTRLRSGLERDDDEEAGLDLLTARTSSGTERHATLRSAIAWSYRLLPETARRLFARLSAFRGGWTLEAAETVCADTAVIDGLAALSDRSLVTTSFGGEDAPPRYRMLESLREFAAERLSDEPDHDVIRGRHMDWVLAMTAEAVEPLRGGPDQAFWLARLEGEHDNLRAALDRAPGLDRLEDGLILVGRLWRFWEARSHLREGRDRAVALLRLAEAEAAPATSASVRARAHVGAGNLSRGLGDFDAAESHLRSAVALAQEAGEKAVEAAALGNVATVLLLRGEHEAAAALYEESLDAARAVGDKTIEAANLTNLTVLAYRRGDYDRAEEYAAQALALYRERGYRAGEAFIGANLALVKLWRGDYAAARALFTEVLAIQRELGNRHEVANLIGYLGMTALRGAAPTPATALFERAAALHRELGSREGEVNALSNLAAAASERGDWSTADALIRRLIEEFGELASGGITGAVNRATRAAAALGRGNLTEARELAEQALAQHRQLGYRIGEADALSLLGDIAFVAGNAGGSRTHYEAALTLAQELKDQRIASSALCGLGRPREALEAAQAAGTPAAVARALDAAADALADRLQDGDAANAARLWAAADTLRTHAATSTDWDAVAWEDSDSLPPPPAARSTVTAGRGPHHARLLAAARTALGGSLPFAAAQEAGRRLTLEEAAALAPDIS